MSAERCSNASRYLGYRFPGCNGGNPCESCLQKYDDEHPTIRMTKKQVVAAAKRSLKKIGFKLKPGQSLEDLDTDELGFTLEAVHASMMISILRHNKDKVKG